MEMIAHAAHEVQRPVFFARIIIIVSYLPIFTLQRVEGRLFRPMAWTVAFALLGALVFALFIAPVLCSCCSTDEIKEWRNPVLHWLHVATDALSTGASTTSNSLSGWDCWLWRRCCR